MPDLDARSAKSHDENWHFAVCDLGMPRFEIPPAFFYPSVKVEDM